MADKAINELVEASQVTPGDLFVLQQDNTAKKLSGQTLINYLLRMIDGHGGVQNVEKVDTSGLKDTYRFSFADQTTFDFVVENGRAISSVEQTAVSGLVRTYTISFNDGTTENFTVNDGRAISSIRETEQNGLTRSYIIEFNDGSSESFDVVDGRSITNIEKTDTNGLTDTYTISYNDGSSNSFDVKNGRGIESFEKVSSENLIDTYRMEYTDGTSDEFTVQNGNGIKSFEKVASEGLTDIYRMEFTDGTSFEFSVKNGEKGDKGDNTYTWIKYAAQEPTEESHSFGNLPDSWIGIYFGPLDEAPTDWKEYAWYQIKGEKGDTGAPATLSASAVSYQVGDSGTIIPSGSWSNSVPVVAQGKYLWTRTTNTFNTGSPVVSYSVTRMGIDGSGSVSSVANISPDENGNVPLTASDVGALPNTGGDMTGELKMNGQPISGLNSPTENDQAANMGFVNQQVQKASPRNLLDNSDFTNPVNQREQTTYAGTANAYTIDRWYASTAALSINLISAGINIDNRTASTNGYITQKIEKIKSGTYTLAILTNEGIALRVFTVAGTTVSGKTYTNTTNCISAVGYSSNLVVQIGVFAGAVVTVYNAALYEGEYTLDTLPEYRSKGYGAELAECQRYFTPFCYKTALYQALGCAVAISATQAVVAIPLPTSMRIYNPSLYVSDVTTFLSKFSFQGESFSITDMYVSNTNIVSAKLVCTVSGELVVGKAYVLTNGGNTGVQLAISAEL